jgi:hypothetical protein
MRRCRRRRRAITRRERRLASGKREECKHFLPAEMEWVVHGARSRVVIDLGCPGTSHNQQSAAVQHLKPLAYRTAPHALACMHAWIVRVQARCCWGKVQTLTGETGVKAPAARR